MSRIFKRVISLSIAFLILTGPVVAHAKSNDFPILPVKVTTPFLPDGPIVPVTTFQAITPFSSVKVISPFYSGASETLINGGEWICRKIVNPGVGDAGIPRRIVWYSPNQVKTFLEAKSKITSNDKFKEAVTLGVETAAQYGIEKAKLAIAAKFGQTVLAQIVPFLGAIGWMKLAYDFFSLLNDSIELARLEKAVAQNTGIIQVENGYGVHYNLWNIVETPNKGSLGVYPRIKLFEEYYIYYGDLYVNLT